MQVLDARHERPSFRGDDEPTLERVVELLAFRGVFGEGVERRRVASVEFADERSNRRERGRSGRHALDAHEEGLAPNAQPRAELGDESRFSDTGRSAEQRDGATATVEVVSHRVERVELRVAPDESRPLPSDR